MSVHVVFARVCLCVSSSCWYRGTCWRSSTAWKQSQTHLLVTGQRCEWRGAGVAVGATLPFPWPQSVMGTLPGCPSLRLRGLPQLPRCEGEVMEHPYRDLTHTLILTGANQCHLYGLVWARFWVLLHPDSHMHMQMRWNCHLQQE